VFFSFGPERFDVAGAGACLKRYTDPSFFTVKSASSGTATGEVQREKKIRKIKVLSADSTTSYHNFLGNRLK